MRMTAGTGSPKPTAKPRPKVVVRRAPPSHTDASSSGPGYGTTKARSYQVAQQAGHRPQTVVQKLAPNLVLDLHPHDRARELATGPSFAEKSALGTILDSLTPKQRQRALRNVTKTGASWQARVLWPYAAPTFGKAPESKEPGFNVTAGTSTPTRYAHADTGTPAHQGKVFYPSDSAYYLSDPAEGDQHKYALKALLHEWAHTQQEPVNFPHVPLKGALSSGDTTLPPGVRGAKVQLEGGAEAFTQSHIRQVLKDAGYGNQDLGKKGDVYKAYVRWVRGHRSPAWINHIQFTPTPPGR